jgi:hypothetical protein
MLIQGHIPNERRQRFTDARAIAFRHPPGAIQGQSERPFRERSKARGVKRDAIAQASLV